MFRFSPSTGATLIVAGTTIGAGMLALPMLASGIGFPLLALLMLATWGFMAIAALITLEANLAIKPGSSLFVMTSRTLGKRGSTVAVTAMLFLYYALLAAYIAAGGNQLGEYLNSNNDNRVGIVLFCLILGSLTSMNIRKIDSINRILFFAMLALFASSLWMLMAGIEPQRLPSAPDSSTGWLWIMPVLFTSFGYHGSIPSLIAYVGPDKTRLTRVFLLGSFLPLVIYLVWLAATLGNIGPEELRRLSENNSVSGLVSALNTEKAGQTLLPVLNMFTALALITSFFGVGLGLFDFLSSALGKPGRIKTAIAVYFPPLCIALWLPDAFVRALNYAALALAVLAILLPAAILHQVRKQQASTEFTLWRVWPVVIFGIGICVLSLL